MNKASSALASERGSVLVVGLLILVTVTIIGIAATRTTEVGLQIAGNEKSHRKAFYAAEASRGWVARKKTIYGAANIVQNQGLSFPDPDNPAEVLELDSTARFNGVVDYLGATAPPRGSGYEVGKFKAHRYRMTCLGKGPASSESRIEAGFYRIGF